MINHASTSEKRGMEVVDKKHVLNVVESSSSAAYKTYIENKQAEYDRRLRCMKDELSTMTFEEKMERKSEADEIMFHYDEQRDLSKIYAHFDMDSYFASVEMRDEPSLRNVPMAVGSEQMISTSNYIARTFGVRSAMPGYIAKKLCPQLVFVGGNYEKYSEVAKIYRQVFKDYDPNFYYVGVDEATLELTEYIRGRTEPATCAGKAFDGECQCCLPRWTPELTSQHPNASKEHVDCGKCNKKKIICNFHVTFGTQITDVVHEIRFRVEQITGGLTCSAGIAPNYFLAKIASEQRKPNNQFMLESDRSKILDFMNSLKIRAVPGIGPSMEYILNGLDMLTCQDVVAKRELVCHLFSKKQSRFLLRACSGISSNEVIDEDTSTEARQSLSHVRTFPATTDRALLEKKLLLLSEYVFDSMKDEGFVGCSKVGIRVKYSTFKNVSRIESVLSPVVSVENVFQIAKKLMHKLLDADKTKPAVRLIGIVIADLVKINSCVLKTMETYFGSNNDEKKKCNAPQDDIVFETEVRKEKPKFLTSQPKRKSEPINKQSSKSKVPSKRQMTLDYFTKRPLQASLKRNSPHGDGDDDIQILDDDKVPLKVSKC